MITCLAGDNWLLVPLLLTHRPQRSCSRLVLRAGISSDAYVHDRLFDIVHSSHYWQLAMTLYHTLLPEGGFSEGG